MIVQGDVVVTVVSNLFCVSSWVLMVVNAVEFNIDDAMATSLMSRSQWRRERCAAEGVD